MHSHDQKWAWQPKNFGVYFVCQWLNPPSKSATVHCLWLLKIGLLQQLCCYMGWEYTHMHGSHITRIFGCEVIALHASLCKLQLSRSKYSKNNLLLGQLHLSQMHMHNNNHGVLHISICREMWSTCTTIIMEYSTSPYVEQPGL